MPDSDDDIDEEELQYFAELCDISDVSFDMKNKGRKEVHLILKAKDSDFNLMKFYLALKGYVDKIEEEIGVMEESGGLQ